MFRNFFSDFSISAFVAATIAALVAYSGPIAIVFQAAKMGGLSDAELASWIWAISVASAVGSWFLSFRFRLPIMVAWNSAGAAILVSALTIYSLSEAIGAYMVSALLMVAIGFSSRFQALILKIPRALASAMLAGILFRFAIEGIGASVELPFVGAPMILIYFVGRVWFPKYAVLAAMVFGIVASLMMGGFAAEAVHFGLAVPVFTVPEFSIQAVFGLALPLFILGMTSQNIPGLAVLEASGYSNPPFQSILKTTGIVSFLTAPFGNHGANLGAITAAIVTGEDCQKDPTRRYVATIICGGYYFVFGMFGVSVVAALRAFPPEFVSVLAGIALFSAILGGLKGAMDSDHADAAMVVFMVCISNVVLLGIGAAFWGILAGVLVLALKRMRRGAK